MVLFRLWVLAVVLVCLDAGDARDAWVRAALTGDDVTAERLARMVASPVTFYRGAIALFRRDWTDRATGLSRSRFVDDRARVFGVGDPHVENFGTLLGRDGRVTLEPDDLDCAGRVPPLWDLRRLAVGLCVAARASSPHRAARAVPDVAREAARAYVAALTATSPDGDDPGVIVADLLRRGSHDAQGRGELREFTEVTDGARRLRRGGVDPDDPAERLEPLSPRSRRGLDALLRSYRETLLAPPEAAYFTVLDAARALGRGGMSAGQARALVLLRGPSDDPADDVLVELKALTESEAPEAAPGDPVGRVLAGRGALWSRPDADPLWGAAWWGACPVQVRAETEAAHGLRVSRMTGSLGGAAAMRALARTLGARLGTIHRRTLSPAQVAAMTADPDAFADEQRDVAARYADRVFDDWRRLRRIARRARPRPVAVASTCAPLDG